MVTIRKLFCLGIGAMVGAWSLPSGAAPQKLYSLAMCVGTFAQQKIGDAEPDSTKCNVTQVQVEGLPTIETPIQARVANLSPPSSNSSINSIDLFVDVNWEVDPTKPITVTDSKGTVLSKWTLAPLKPRHLKIGNLPPIKPQTYVTVTFSVNKYSCGEGAWDVTAYTGSGYTGGTFDRVSGFVPQQTVVACGNFNCGDSIDEVQPQGKTSSPNDLGYIAHLRRGANENGATDTCTRLFTYVTPTTFNDAIMQTVWDKPPQPQPPAQPESPVFSYEVNLEPTSVTTVTAKLNKMEVAWLLTTDETPVPDLQPALMCQSQERYLPTPYTTVVSDNGDKIQVAPPLEAFTNVVAPFHIIIGQERLLVTKVIANTNTWFVTRGLDQTDPARHTLGDKVMSTPFPIVQIGQYDETFHKYANRSARVCVQELIQAEPGSTQFKAIIIDGSDGWVRIGNF